MAVNFWNPRRRKISLIAGIILLVLFAVLLTINAILAPIIGRKIKAAVTKGSDSLYQVSFSRISVNVFTGNLNIDDVRLVVDSSRAKVAGKVVSGKAKALEVSGIGVFSYWLHKKLEVDQVKLIEPNVEYNINKKSSHPDNKPLYQKIAPLKLVAIHTIVLSDARLTLSDFSGAKASVQHLKDLNLEASDLRIDSVADRDTTRTLFCRDIVVGIDYFKGFTDGGLYHYGFRSAHFSTRSEKLVIRAIELKPLPEKSFFEKSNSDRFDIALDSLVLQYFNYRSFLNDHFLVVKKVGFFNGHISVFGSPDGKPNLTDRANRFPHVIVRGIPMHFTIDTLDASGILVSYREMNKDAGKTGLLEFKDTRANFLNISNEPDKLKSQPLCRAQLSTFLMGKGKLELSIDFNLADKQYAYNYQGRLAAMPLIDLNPVTMPLGQVEIKSGDLKSLDFAFKADRLGSTGTLHLLYNDLKADILKPDYDKKVIKTLLVNAFVIKHDNPDKPQEPARFAKVVFLRPKSYPFFRTLWETLFSGIKPCAGVGYAVKPDPEKPLTRKELKARKKALKKALKAKKKADKDFKKKLSN